MILCKQFVDLSLWSQVVFLNNDDMTTMVKRAGETFETQQLLVERKAKFLELIIMNGEGYFELYWQGLKPEDKLHDLLMDMEPKGWIRDQEVMRRYTQNMALKADMWEHRPKGQSHVINNM